MTYKEIYSLASLLQNLLWFHPLTFLNCNLGVKHDKYGEAPKAFIVKSDPNVTEESVHEWLKDKVDA